VSRSIPDSKCTLFGLGRDICANLPIKDGISLGTLKIALEPYVSARRAFVPKSGIMSQQFIYLQFKVAPKGTLTRTTGSEMVAIELPFEHVVCWKLRHPGRYLTNEEMAIKLTQGVAIAAADRFVVLSHDPLKEQEIHSGTVLSSLLPIMNERDCDYEDDGIRAWFIGPGLG
jgi:hypothetical protein